MEKCPKCETPTSIKPVQVIDAAKPESRHAPLPPARHQYTCGQTECGHTWVK
jgi:hypothetical protein